MQKKGRLKFYLFDKKKRYLISDNVGFSHGIKKNITLIAWISIIFQLLTPISLAFTPVIAATTQNSSTSQPVKAGVETVPYVLGPGETVQSVAKKYKITVDELKRLNQFRAFAKPFVRLTTGDEIDVPKKAGKMLPAADSRANSATQQQLANDLAKAGTLFANSSSGGKTAAEEMARSSVVGATNQSVQQWLNQFGTAQVQLNVDNNLNLHNSSLDLLTPLYGTPSSMLFSQLGVRNPDNRNTVNLGLGVRHFQDHWMYGVNSFYDNDLTGHNQRIGIGAEAATDYLRFSANSYFGISHWHQSRDFTDYNERPASGYDVRANAYLPSYPQLGGKLVYEQYNGNNVALFGKDLLQKNPHALTTGLNYTPVPLLTLGAEHRFGSGHYNDSNINLQLNYRMGEPLRSLLDPDKVEGSRTLLGSRYDLVDRNNSIVMDYQKQKLIQLTLPPHVTGTEGENVVLAAKVIAKHAIELIEWDASSLLAAGGSIDIAADTLKLVLTLPPYELMSALGNGYTLSAIARDIKGNISPRVNTTVTVTAGATLLGNLSVVDNNAVADGVANNQVQLIVKDSNNHPLSGQVVTFTASNGATLVSSSVSTNSQGIALASLHNTKAGTTVVTATLDRLNQSVNTTFIADSTTATITSSNLVVMNNNALANGNATNQVQATITDANGNPVAGQSVNFSADNDAKLTNSKVTTDINGAAIATLSTLRAGSVNVSANINNSTQSVQATFVADQSNANITAENLKVINDHALADGKSSNQVQAKITDIAGNPLQGIHVTFSATNGAVVAPAADTDNNGLTTVAITNIKAGITSVTADINGRSQTVDTLFVADSSTATLVSGNLTLLDNGALANGSASNRVQALITDAHNNPLSGQAVNFAASLGASIVTTPVLTDNNGIAVTTFTSLIAGTSTITATVNGSSQSVESTFIADSSSAMLAPNSLTLLNDNAPANGTASNQVQVLVTDGQGNPIAAQAVNFTASNGATVTTTPVLTASSGIAVATLTNLNAGISNVTASVNSSSQTIATTFVADISTATLSSSNITILDNGALANGSASNRVQVRIVDAHDNPVGAQSISFSANNGASIVTTPVLTDLNGLATTTITSVTAGISSVIATLNGNSQTVDTTFIADSNTATLASGSLTVLDNNAIANGTATNRVQVRVTDAHNNPLSGQAVSFAATQGAHVITTPVNTDSDGIAVATFTSLTAGSSSVTASTPSGSQTTSVTFIADSSSATLAAGSLLVLDNNALANGSATNRVQVMVRDANGNPVSGQVVNFSVTQGVTLISSAVNTDNDGIATTTLTSLTAGNSSVTATLNSDSLTVAIAFVADSSSATLNSGSLTVLDNNALANGRALNRLQAIVTDAHGNPVSGQVVSFSANNGALLIATAVTTDANGAALTTLTNVTAGITTVTAEFNGASQTLDTSFVADSSTASLSSGNLTVLNNGAVANGSATNRVQAQIFDANGNPVGGESVNFTATNGATVSNTSVNTDNSGIASITLTNLTTGVSSVTATLNDSSQTVNTTFIADSTTAELSSGSLTILNNNALANGVATDRLQVRVADAHGNPVSGQTVSFTANNGATLVSAVVTTDTDGLASTTLTSLTAGNSMVTASVNGSSQSVTLIFIADSSTAVLTTGSLTVLDNGALANGSASNRVQVLVTDAHGNPVSDQAVSFTATQGATVVATPVKSDIHGVAIATLTSLTADISNVTATLNNSSQTVDIHFIADESTATLATGSLTVLDNDALANGSATNRVQARVTDAHGNPVSGQAVTFTSTQGVTLINASANTDDNGLAITTLTSTIAGSSNVTATIDESSQTVTTTFIADSSTATLTAGNLSVLDNGALADGMATNRVQVLVVDAHNNPVSGEAVSFSASHGATVVSSPVTTDDEGIAITTLTSVTAGISTLTATVNGSSQTLDTQFIADGSSATLTNGSLTVVDNNALANGTATNQVQVLVVDAHNNPVSGQVVNFTATHGATIVTTPVSTNDVGIAVATLTSIEAGISNVTATVNGSMQSIETTFVADSSTATLSASTLTVLDNNALANGSASNRVQVLVTDAHGNPVVGQAVSFSATHGATVIATPVNSDINGIATTTLTNVTAGSSSVTAILNSSSQSVVTTFVADSSTATLADNHLTVLDNNALANGSAANRVQAVITDAHGNPVSGQTVNFSATNGAQLAGASVVTNSQGIATTTLSSVTAGISSVTASFNDSTLTVDTTFIADSSSATLASDSLTIVDNNAPATGLALNRVQVRVTDAHGNPVSGQAVSFTASNSATITTTVNTDNQGLAIATLSTIIAGISTVTATVNSTSQTIDTTFVADNATATLSADNLTVLHNQALANGSATNQVQATVVDAHGNPVGDMAVNFTATLGATVVTTPVNTDKRGIATTTLTSVTAGDSTVTATVNNSSQTVGITFVADSGSATLASGNLTILDNNAPANGNATNQVQALITDAHGNPVSQQVVNFSSTHGATVITTSVSTNDNGIATTTLTNTSAGISSVTATLNGSSQTVDTTFIADSSTATLASGSLTLLDNNAVANGNATNRVQVIVTDAHGNPVSAQSVGFTATHGATIAITPVTTNSAGIATTTLTSVTAGTSTITATVNGTSQTLDSTFVADSSSAILMVDSLTVLNDNAIANGSATNQVQIQVIDAHDNPVSGQTISFTATHGATLITTDALTNKQGIATTTLTSLFAGMSSVTATFNGNSQSVSTMFVADSSTATLTASSLTVLDNNAVANGSATNRIQVIVTDAHGNPVNGQAVSLAATNGATVVSTPVSTGNDGVAIATLTNLTAGSSNLTATVNGSSQTIATNFIADSSTATLASGSLTILDNGALANGSAANRVQVVVIDAHGNPVNAQQVSFSASNNGSIVTTPVSTNTLGVATTTLTNLLAGTTSVTATINGSSQSIDTTFIADSTSATLSSGSLTVLDNGALANGNAINRVQAQVTDAQGNPVSGQIVSFTATRGATVITASVATNNTGGAIASFSSLVAGTSSVTATVNGSSRSIDMTFVADSSTATLANSSLTVLDNGAIANHLATNRVRAIVTDAQGNPVSGQAVSFTASNGASVVSSPVNTDIDGIAIVTLSNTQAGLSQVTATVNGSSQSIDTTFVADSSTATLASGSLSVLDDGALANGTATNRVQVIVSDANGNPVSGQSVSFSATNGASIVTTPVITGSDGIATTTLTNTQAGGTTITALLGSHNQSIGATFVADSSTATLASNSLTLLDNNAIANGNGTNRVQAVVTDAHGNPVSGQVVSFSATHGTTVVTNSVTTGSDGIAITTLTSLTAGISSVTATVSSGSQSINITFIADSSSATLATGSLTVLDNGAIANGSATNRVQARVTDAHGNPVSDQTVSFTATNGAAIVTTSVNTDGLGIAITTLNSVTAGTSTVTATVNGTSLNIDTTFIADSSTSTLTAGSLTVLDNGAIANGNATNRVQVVVTDAHGNPVNGQAVSFSVTNGVTVITTPVETNNVGIATTTLTSTEAGNSSVTATVNGSSQNVAVTFVADSSTSTLASGDLIVLINGAIANGSATNQVQALVTDAHGNPVSGQSVSFSATNGATITTTPVETDNTGIATTTLSSVAAGTSTVTATVNGNTQNIDTTFIADSTTATLTSGNLTILVNQALANGNESNEVQALVTDAHGNPVSGQFVDFTATHGAAVMRTAVLTNGSGIATTTLTSVTAGISSVTATVNGNSQKVDVSFIADSSTATLATGSLTVLNDNAIANGTATNQVQVVVTDAHGNPVSGATVGFSANHGATVGTTPVTTSDEGIANITLTNVTMGNSTVTATVNGSSQSIISHFIADNSTATLASDNLTVLNNNAIANGIATNQIQVLVTDAHGNPVSGQAVSFTVTHGATLSATPVSTDIDGIATTTLTNVTAGISSVTATVNGNSQTVDTAFIADGSTATITTGSLMVLNDNAIANGSATNQVQVIITDAHGNPVNAAVVSFSATHGATVALTSVNTNSDGIAIITLTNVTAGISTVTATVNGHSQTVETTFIADGSTATITVGNLTVLDNNAIANGNATNQVQVSITDAHGNAVNDAVVSFSATNGATVVTTSVNTGSDGIATTTLTNVTAGTSSVTATINGNSQTVDTTFIADSNTATLASGSLTVLDNNAIANGTATNRVQVRVTDAHNNPLSGQAVSFAATQGAHVITTPVNTDSDGIAVATFTSLTAGSSSVTASTPSGSQTTSVTFIADSSSATLATGSLLVLDNNALANGSATNRVQARVTDAHGNPITGQAVSFSATHGATVSSAPVNTNDDGIAIVTLTNVTAGSSTVTATTNGNSQSVATTFIADNTTATIAAGSLTVLDNNALANGSASNQVQVRVTDAHGNPVSGQSVSFTATQGATLATTPVDTNSDGIAVTSLTNVTAGTTAVTATTNSHSQTVDTTFVADSSTATIGAGNLTVLDNNALANGVASNRVKVIVTDAHGNPVSQQAVSFSANNGATAINTSVNTDNQGVAMTIITSVTAGDSTITATLNGSSQNVTTTFVADSNTAAITAGNLTVLNDNAIANGIATNQVQVLVTDAQGNAVKGVAVSFSANNGAILTATPVNTDSQGIASATLTNITAGITTVTATVNGSSESVTTHFTADSSSATLATGSLTILNNNAPATGSAANRVQVIVIDAHGNPVSGVAVSFSATNGATVVITPVETTSDGTATTTLTNTTAGISTVTATVNGNSQTVDTTFIADSSTATITAGSLTVLNDNAIANGSATNQVQARVTDAHGNPISGQPVSFTATHGATVTMTPVNTNSDGIATTTLTSVTAGISTVTAITNGNSQTADTTFIADSSTATITSGTLTVLNDNATANGSATNQVQAIVTDAHGNPVNGVAVSFSATHGATIAAVPVNTSSKGIATATLTNVTAGISTVTATVNGNSQTVDTTFVADSSTATLASGSLTILNNNAVANGSATNQVQALVTDAHNNPVKGQTVSFSANPGATMVAASVQTDINGIAATTLTSVTAGISTVTATVNDSSQTVDTTFVADNSTSTMTAGSLTVLNDNAIANGSATNQVQVVVTDAHGNRVNGQAVSFTATNGAIVSNTPVNTNNSGIVTTTLTNVSAGTTVVTATTNGHSQTVSTTFVADPSTAQVYTLAITDNNAVANGSSINRVRALIVDAHNNPVSAANISFTATNGATLTSVTIASDIDGYATNTLTNTLAGISTVTATLGGSHQNVNTTFIADAATAKINVGDITLVKNNALADNATLNTVQVKVTDANGNLVVGQNVSFTATNSAIVTSPVVTGNDGIAIANLHNGVSGVSTLTATINGNNQLIDTTFTPVAVTGVTVNGTTFAANSGFPTTGFVNATFQIALNGSSSNFTWSSSNAALVSVNNQGQVTMVANFPVGTPAITINIVPTGGGRTTTYSFKVGRWFINNGGLLVSAATIDSYCPAQGSGYATPSYTVFTDATPNNAGTAGWGTTLTGRAVSGKLWNEWGNMGVYGSGWVATTHWAKETYLNSRHGVDLDTGFLRYRNPANTYYGACTRAL